MAEAMRMVAIPYAAATCRVCGAAATRVIRPYDMAMGMRKRWEFYCDRHGDQLGRGLSTHPDFYQEIKEVEV